MTEKNIEVLSEENKRLLTEKSAISLLLDKYRKCLLTFRQSCVCDRTKDNEVEELEGQYEKLSRNQSNESSSDITSKTKTKGPQRTASVVPQSTVRPILPNTIPLILLPSGQLVSSLPMITLANQNLSSKVTSNQKIPITRLRPMTATIRRKSDFTNKLSEKTAKSSKNQLKNPTEVQIIVEKSIKQSKPKNSAEESTPKEPNPPVESQCKILGDRGIKLNLTLKERMNLNFKRLKSGEISSFKDEELNLTVCTKQISWAGQTVSRIIYRCDFDDCQHEIANKYAARDHSLTHSGTTSLLPTYYWCDICGNTYEKKISYLKHKYSVHKIAEKPVLSCQLCDYKTIVAERLKEHSFVHIYEKPVKCDVNGCHKYFKSQIHMRKHKYLSHVADLKCQFPGCNTKFKDYVHKHKHWKIHRNLPTNVAKLKEQMESNAYAVVIHPKNQSISEIRQKFVNQENGKTEIGGRMGFKCNRDDCPIVTITMERMNRHLISHSSEQPFECDLCAKKYRDRNRLKLHKDEQHFDKKRPLLYCQFESCQFLTRNKASLKAHCLTHCSDRPQFKCDVEECLKSFASLQSMRLHKRNVHSDVRPYPCEWPGCEKRFKMNATMKKHLRSHCENGIRFECHLCPNDYRYKSDLNKHLKTKH